LLHARHAADLLLDGKSDLLLDLYGIKRWSRRIDLDLYRRCIGKGIDVEFRQRERADGAQCRHGEKHREAVGQRKVDDPIQHGSIITHSLMICYCPLSTDSSSCSCCCCCCAAHIMTRRVTSAACRLCSAGSGSPMAKPRSMPSRRWTTSAAVRAISRLGSRAISRSADRACGSRVSPKRISAA